MQSFHTASPPDGWHWRPLRAAYCPKMELCGGPWRHRNPLSSMFCLSLAPPSPQWGQGELLAWITSSLGHWVSGYCFDVTLGCLFLSDSLCQFDRKNVLESSRESRWSALCGRKIRRWTLRSTREKGGLGSQARVAFQGYHSLLCALAKDKGPCALHHKFLRYSCRGLHFLDHIHLYSVIFFILKAGQSITQSFIT